MEPDGKGNGELGWGPLSSSHHFLHSEEPENFKFYPGLPGGHKGIFTKAGEQNKVDITATFICNFLMFGHLLGGSSFILLSWCHSPMIG